MSEAVRVTTREELLAANARGPGSVFVEGTIAMDRPLVLADGVRIQGLSTASLTFAPGSDGVVLGRDCALSGLAIRTDVDKCAIANSSAGVSLGQLELTQLSVEGCVRISAEGTVTTGVIRVRGLDIVRADARSLQPRPSGFGVHVVPGAFTVQNAQASGASQLVADLRDISVGRPNAPVLGSGVFVAGAGSSGGSVLVTVLRTGDVHSTGGLEEGVSDVITGGVFTVYGVTARVVENAGSVTTYGVNDMVLDNWGTVDRWTALAPITSYGTSGVGFVNFGSLGELEVRAAIETYGHGARGFNVYDGTLNSASFDRIVTHGDGSVGVQVSKPLGALSVRRGIETLGGVGQTLVKGVIVELPAIPLSVKPGGAIGRVHVRGGLRAHHDGVPAFANEGSIASLQVEGGMQGGAPVISADSA